MQIKACLLRYANGSTHDAVSEYWRGLPHRSRTGELVLWFSSAFPLPQSSSEIATTCSCRSQIPLNDDFSVDQDKRTETKHTDIRRARRCVNLTARRAIDHSPFLECDLSGVYPSDRDRARKLQAIARFCSSKGAPRPRKLATVARIDQSNFSRIDVV
jgi:hypothetical protein